jgi:hypothetical protein
MQMVRFREKIEARLSARLGACKCFFDKPDPPAPPDYKGAAQEQGEANLEAGLQSSVLSNPNIITPYGKQTVTYSTTGGSQGYYDPWSGQYIPGSGGQTQPTVTQEFSPQQQGLYNSQTNLSQSLLDTAQGGLNTVNTMMGTPFSMNGLPDPNSNVTGNLPTRPGLDTQGLPGFFGIDPSKLSNVQDLNTQGLQGLSGIDLSRLQNVQGLNADNLPGVNGIDLSRLQNVQDLNANNLQGVNGMDTSRLQNVQDLNANNLQGVNVVNPDTLAQRNTTPGVVDYNNPVVQALIARNQPFFDQERSRNEADLIARGHNPGGTGYDASMDTLNRRENDMRMAALLSGGQEQQRLFAMESQLRAQGLSEQEARQQAQQALRSQQFGERNTTSQFQEQQRGNRLNEMQSQQQADQSLRGQQFGERQTITNMQAALRAQGLNEQEIQSRVDSALRNQQFGERQDIASFQQALRAQGLSEQQIQATINAAMRGQQFGERKDIASFGEGQRASQLGENQAQLSADSAERERQIQEQTFLRQLPLSEINALRTGGQPSLPNFQNFQGSNIAPAPLFDATLAGGNFALQNYQNQLNADPMGGIFDLFGAGLGAAGAAGGFPGLFGI